MRVFVTGASGQVGGEMSRACAGDQIITGMRPTFDLTDWPSVRRAIEDAEPDVVVHLGAYTDVNGCERDPDRAYRTNALGTRYVALAARAAAADLVVVSTDYVFDGQKGEPYLEWDETNPLSVYGRSKLAGEREALQLHDRCYVVRTSWVYSPRGRNFVKTMLRLGAERPEITVVDDERGGPTLAGDLADALRLLAVSRCYGIYHFSNVGVCSRYELASRAVQRAGLTARVVPIGTADYLERNPLPARRPSFSALRNVAGAAIGIELPPWEDALDRLVNDLTLARRRADPVEAVGVVIPTLNGARFLPTCLDALRRQTRPADEVVVVDDGSVDETAALIATCYPEVRLVRYERPRGVAAGFNSGIRATVSPLVVLLNNDTEAEPTWLDELTRPLAEDQTLQLVAAKLLLFDRRQVLHSAGDFYGRDGLPGSREVWETDRGQYDCRFDTFGPCAAAAAYRRSTLDALGYFDESLGSYCEDVDLSFRAKLAGYRCHFAPAARVYHQLSATGGGALSSYFVGRNTLWILAQNMPAELLVRYWPWVVARQLSIAAEALRHWREPAAHARLRGQLAGLRGWSGRLGRRGAIQKSRRVSIAALDAVLT